MSALVPFLRRAPSLALALALAGCASMAPPYERPAAPVAAVFPFNDAGPAPAASATDWRTYFGDARLDRLIELALANNRDLRVSVLNIETARAQLGIQRSAEFPTIGATVYEQRQTGTPTIYAAGASISAWEIDLFGRVRSLTNAAAAQLVATEEARKAAQISLVASVANAYYALAADDTQIDLAKQTLGTFEDTLRLTQLRFDNGVSSDLDLQSARSPVQAARVALAAARRQRSVDQNMLELLLGQPLPDDLPPPPSWSDLALPDIPVGIPSDVLLQRPDVRQAEQLLVAANANIGAARAAFWPTISLTGTFGTASTQLNDLFEHHALTFLPQLFLPIFDAGRNRANLRASEAARDIAVAQYEKSIQAAFTDVANALAGRATLRTQLEAQQGQTDAEDARFRLSTLRFDNGVASSLELLDTQRSLFSAQQATVAVRLALLQNQVTMYRALGGGWNEPSTPARVSAADAPRRE